MEYYIIHCNKCATPQYIKSGQKTRKCPYCGNRMVCKKMRIFAKTNSLQEANQIVRDIKTPTEVKKRISLIANKYKNASNQKSFNYQLLGDLLSELIAVFPRALPESYLIQRAEMLGLKDEEFIEKILDQLNQHGLMTRNKDQKGRMVLYFPSLPFKFKKLYVKKPKPKKEMEEERKRIWKASQK